MPVRGKNKTPKSQLKHFFKVLPAAETNQFFYRSTLKFTSIVWQVDIATWDYKKANPTLGLSQLLKKVLFLTPFYCTQRLQVTFCQWDSTKLSKRNLYLLNNQMQKSKHSCIQKIYTIFRATAVLIKLQNTGKHDGKATFNLCVLVTSTSLELAHILRFPNDHKLTGLSSVKVFSLMSQIIYHLQLVDMVGWLKINRYCIYFYILIFNFCTFLISQ